MTTTKYMYLTLIDMTKTSDQKIGLEKFNPSDLMGYNTQFYLTPLKEGRNPILLGFSDEFYQIVSKTKKTRDDERKISERFSKLECNLVFDDFGEPAIQKRGYVQSGETRFNLSENNDPEIIKEVLEDKSRFHGWIEPKIFSLEITGEAKQRGISIHRTIREMNRDYKHCNLSTIELYLLLEYGFIDYSFPRFSPKRVK